MKKLFKIKKFYIKIFVSLLLFLIASISVFSQNVGMSATGAIPPNTSAGLDVNYADKGILIPRVALVDTNNFAPLSAHIAGMIVYNTATTTGVKPGFYFNNGAKWIASSPKANAAGDMQYWDGTKWINIPSGQPGQLLHINSSGIPSWAP